VPRRHLVLAIALVLAAGSAAFFATRGNDAVHALSAKPGAMANASAPSDAAPLSERPEPAKDSVRAPAAASSASPSAQHNLSPHASDAARDTAAPPWKTWRDAPPIDRNRALDLLADKVMKEQDEKADARSVLERMKFERNPIDPALTDTAKANLQQYFSGLDADVQQHVAIGSVECRANACQALFAANGIVNIDTGNGASLPRGPIDLSRTVNELMQQPWWAGSGYEIGGFSAEFRDGYALYTINFARPGK
jgi:hypothetical protein